MDINDRQKLFESYIQVTNNSMYNNSFESDSYVLDLLREDFNKDVIFYDKHFELSYDLSYSQIITESRIDEALFDTIKNFGKNAISSLTNSWKQAKEQGNKDEMERLSKKIKQTKAQQSKGSKAAGTKTTKSISRTKATGTRKSVDSTNTKAPRKASSRGKQKVAMAASKAVMDALEKQDPTTSKIIKSAKPQEIADGLNDAQVKKEMSQISKQIANETPSNGEGFVGKLTSWLKKNPIKGTAAVALLGVITTAAAVGSGGVLPLLGAMVGGAAKGAAIGGIGGGVVGAAKSAISDTIAGNKFDIKKTAKAGLAGAKSGAKTGAVVGAAGAFAGSAIKGVSKGVQNLMSGGEGKVTSGELKSAAQQNMDSASKQNRIYADAMDKMGVKSGSVKSLPGGGFSITPEGGGEARAFTADGTDAEIGTDGTFNTSNTPSSVQVSSAAEQEAKSIIQKMKDAGFGTGTSGKRPTWNGSFRQFEDPNSVGQKLISNGTDGTGEYNYWLKQKLYGKISDQDFIEKMKEFARTGAQQ